jgi:hypothetical protein
MRVIGNCIVKYDVNTRHIWRESTNIKLEEKLRQTIRLKHYSLKTKENYVGWYRRFVLWHRERCGHAVHPAVQKMPGMNATHSRHGFGAFLTAHLILMGRSFQA